ncbi:MAG: integrase, partial [Eubacteriaceae bacterium]|nr:integrase [Eubacteriaceae bacterium]
MPNTYTKEKEAEYTLKLRELIGKLPEFAGDFFRGISNTTQIRTRVAYA